VTARAHGVVRIAPVLGAALPQVIVNPTASPTLNDGGWVYNAALLLFVVGALLLLLIVFGYMRLAPRFQTDEGGRKAIRAPRIQPGKDFRRPVNVTGTPMVVEPPAVAVAAAPAPAVVAPPAPPPRPPAVVPGGLRGGPGGRDRTRARSGSNAAAGARSGSTEVSLDQETFDRVLAELLDKGTERRVAEGQARRAAMIAARKKAEG
jgi:hypothetical protein